MNFIFSRHALEHYKEAVASLRSQNFGFSEKFDAIFTMRQEIFDILTNYKN